MLLWDKEYFTNISIFEQNNFCLWLKTGR